LAVCQAGFEKGFLPRLEFLSWCLSVNMPLFSSPDLPGESSSRPSALKSIGLALLAYV
jgi:hypothetical protein